MMMPPASLPCREQAAWGTTFVVVWRLLLWVLTYTHFAALANIAGDGPNVRDIVLAAGVVQVAHCCI